jgi:hypothetical protein
VAAEGGATGGGAGVVGVVPGGGGAGAEGTVVGAATALMVAMWAPLPKAAVQAWMRHHR